LPKELKSVEQYRQIIDPFIAKHLQNYYYAYVIHNKIGMLSDGQHHPHVHIMFSERIIDDVEQKQERDAKAFFLYPARKKKDGSLPSFAEKWKRGAPKDRKWCSHQYVCQMREDFARIQNEVLERNGFSIRVDHRSLQSQKEEAELNGDSFLARLFSRVPEKYIGIIGSQEDNEPRLERLKQFRDLRKQHFDLVMKLDALTKEADELEIKDAVKLSSTKAKSLMDSKEYTKHKFFYPYLAEMKRRMMTAVAEVNRWKRFIISQHHAEQQAKLEYMTKAERQIWLNYFQTLAQKKHLENFLKTLKKPDENQSAKLNAYNDLVAGIKSKIFSLFTASLAMKKSVEEIEQRLASPEFKNNIALVTHQLLQSNSYALKWLKKASDELDKAVSDLSNDLFSKTMEEPQESFKTREIYDLIRFPQNEPTTCTKVALCLEHESARKIELIAAGILRKNFKFVLQLEEIETRGKELISLVYHVKEQLNALEVRLANDKVGTRYRVMTSDTLSNNALASLIADAILNEPEAVQLVARLDDNFLETEKTWELMSEFDKDELIRKKIIREL
jgi:hypothetical protein